MSILELNLRAKKTIPVPPPQAPKNDNGKLQLEAGKKYVLNCGAVTEPMIQPDNPHHVGKLLCSSFAELAPQGLYTGSIYYWDIDGGAFTGTVPESPKSIRREWHPTWKEEEAWMAGAKFEYQLKDGHWHSLGQTYKIVCDAFGPDSKSTKEWWQKYFVPVFGVYPVRKV